MAATCGVGGRGKTFEAARTLFGQGEYRPRPFRRFLHACARSSHSIVVPLPRNSRKAVCRGSWYTLTQRAGGSMPLASHLSLSLSLFRLHRLLCNYFTPAMQMAALTTSKPLIVCVNPDIYLFDISLLWSLTCWMLPATGSCNVTNASIFRKSNSCTQPTPQPTATTTSASPRTARQTRSESWPPRAKVAPPHIEHER